jgi:hypothetical protein
VVDNAALERECAHAWPLAYVRVHVGWLMAIRRIVTSLVRRQFGGRFCHGCGG